jgi:hypothetical protein
MNDLAIMARKLALRHVRNMVEANYDEQDIISSQAYSGCGQSFVDNTGGDEFGAYGVKISGHKVRVERVLNHEVNMTFNLHRLYAECKKGQLSLL